MERQIPADIVELARQVGAPDLEWYVPAVEDAWPATVADQATNGPAADGEATHPADD